MLNKIKKAINSTFQPSSKYIYEWKPIYRMNFFFRDSVNFKRHHLLTKDVVITNRKDDMTMTAETTWPYFARKAQEMLCCFYRDLWDNICSHKDNVVVHFHQIIIQNYDGSDTPTVVDKRHFGLYAEYTLTITSKNNTTAITKNVILINFIKDPDSKNVYSPCIYTESNNEDFKNTDVVIMSFCKTLVTLLIKFQPEVINRAAATIIDTENQDEINKFFFGDTREYMVAACFNRLYLDKKIVSSKHKSDYYNKPNTQKIRKLYYRSFMEKFNHQFKEA